MKDIKYFINKHLIEQKKNERERERERERRRYLGRTKHTTIVLLIGPFPASFFVMLVFSM